jgi:DNA-binding transcriptional MerR regulator
MRMMAELINGDFSLDDMVTTYDHIKRLENMSITTEQIGQIVKHLEKVGAKDLMATGDLANYRREQEESVKIAESKKRTANEQLDETNKRLQEAAKKEQSM